MKLLLEVYIIIKTPQLTKYNRLRSQRVPTQNYGGLRVCSTHGKVLGKTASTKQYRAVSSLVIPDANCCSSIMVNSFHTVQGQ